MLAISADLDQLRRIVVTLERAGAEVDAVRSSEAIAAEVIPHRYVFFSASDGDVAALGTLVPKLRDRAHVTIVTPRASLSDLTTYLRDDRINHVVVGEELDNGVFVTAQKLLTGDIFGIEKYLPAGTPVHYARLRDTISKKPRTSRLAPPTSAPSTSGRAARSRMLSGFTLPP